jgi:hypothetical protein
MSRSLDRRGRIVTHCCQRRCGWGSYLKAHSGSRLRSKAFQQLSMIDISKDIGRMFSRLGRRANIVKMYSVYSSRRDIYLHSTFGSWQRM